MNDKLVYLQNLIADPEFLLDEIDLELDRVPIEELPHIVLSTDNAGGEAPPYREVKGSQPRHQVLDLLLTKWRGDIHDACCVRYEYCVLKKRHAETIDLCKSVIDGIVSASIVMPIPVATVAVYCVQSLFLDRICKCE